MKIKSYDELIEANQKIKATEKKLATKRKALTTASKKVTRLRTEVEELDEELKLFFIDEDEEKPY